MCLIAVAWLAHPVFRLALIANRDELHARPTAAAEFDPTHPEIYGGRDLLQGGGWLMVSTRGRLAAVTNVRSGLASGLEPQPRSRGALVRGFVAGDASADDYVTSLGAGAAHYGRFNLLVWDFNTLAFASNHPHYASRVIPPGVHAVSNGALDARWPKSTQATRALSTWLSAAPIDAEPGPGTHDVSPLLHALADPKQAPDTDLPDTGVGRDLERKLSSVFVRDSRYGTRCSSIVLIEGETMRFVERRYGANARIVGESSQTMRMMPSQSRDAGNMDR